MSLCAFLRKNLRGAWLGFGQRDTLCHSVNTSFIYKNIIPLPLSTSRTMLVLLSLLNIILLWSALRFQKNLEDNLRNSSLCAERTLKNCLFFKKRKGHLCFSHPVAIFLLVKTPNYAARDVISLIYQLGWGGGVGGQASLA